MHNYKEQIDKLKQILSVYKTEWYSNDNYTLIDIYTEILPEHYNLDEMIKANGINLNIDFYYPEVIMTEKTIYYVGITEIPEDIECFTLRIKKYNDEDISS